MNKSDQDAETGSQMDANSTLPAGVENQSRRDAMRKLGKYGKVSAVVTAVVYTGLHSQNSSAITPPPPPSFGP